jgi:precorrin-6B C5,15-methyltransferase / cobalt-precorrin-6B C5,C15-methyltransferase
MHTHQNIVQPWLSIIGIGADGIQGLSDSARTLIAAADVVVGGARHLSMANKIIRGEQRVWPSPIQDGIAAVVDLRGRPTVVLASGDPFLFGVGSLLSTQVPPGEFACLPAPSSIALAAGRLGWAQQEANAVSLHGRALETIIPSLQPGAKLLVLSWDGTTPGNLAELLIARGMAKSHLYVLENLGSDDERIRSAPAAEFPFEDIVALNIVAIDVVAGPEAKVVPLGFGIPDEFFDHDGQLTKRDVRAVTMAALSPGPGELLWDIGLGAGAVAIEWLLAHPTCRAIGVEADLARARRAKHNSCALGVPHLEIIDGAAPAALANLPQPDAIFVGGGATSLGLFDAVWRALPKGGRLVVNAVTLETEALLLQWHGSHGGDLLRVGLARAEKVGRRHGWRAAMPVTQWRVVKS